jgi:predicted CXXCH cytochrome family protein
VRTALKQSIRCLVLALVLITWSTAVNADGPGYSFGETSEKSGNCLDCHGVAGKVATRYVIDPVKYGHTNHARIGCLACHDAADGKHPARGGASVKADCTFCHVDIGAEYTLSGHASKAACTGCHNPHTANAPTEISGQEMNRMCAGCHDTYGITASHAKWLPQADLHIEMLPCVTCHSGSKNYVINLYITTRSNDGRFGKFDLAGYDELKRITGGKEIITLFDSNGDNYISLAELGNFNRNPLNKGLRLKAMMTPELVTHSLRILDNRRDCTFCHASGPGTMQSSVVALPQADGTFKRVAVEKGAVLEALYGTPDFYMTGKTRNDTMNKVGLLIIAGGMIMPVGHGFLRLMSRNIRNRKEDRHE